MQTMSVLKFFALLFALLGSMSAWAQDLGKALEVDAQKSMIRFSIEAKCRMLPGGYTVQGVFSGVNGKIRYSSGNVAQSNIQVSAPIQNLKTQTLSATGCAKVVSGDDEERDKHLKTADFFDALNFPEARFKSLSLQQAGNNEFSIKGKLSIHGISKTVVLGLKPVNQYRDNQGRNHLTFVAETKLNRMDFGVGAATGEITGLGSFVYSVSDEVALTVDLDAYEVAQ